MCRRVEVVSHALIPVIGIFIAHIKLSPFPGGPLHLLRTGVCGFLVLASGTEAGRGGMSKSNEM